MMLEPSLRSARASSALAKTLFKRFSAGEMSPA
jgi:hypothetical protein